MKKMSQPARFLTDNGMYIVMALVFVYFAVSAPGFLTANNIARIPLQSAFVILIATGMTMVIITGGIDLSVGSVVAFTAVIFSLILRQYAVAVPLAILGALIAGATSGAFVGFFIVKFRVPPFIATLAMMTIARGLARLFAQNSKIFIENPAIEKYSDFIMIKEIAITNAIGVPYLVVLMLAVVVFLGLVLMKTRFGRYVTATGGNEEATKLSGVNVNQVKFMVYVINAFLAAVVGVMMASKFMNGNPEFGVMWELDAIAACVVGGTSLMGGKGNIFKTLFGALLIGMLDNGLLAQGRSSEMIYIIKGIIILGAVIIDQVKEK
ncbi:MAG TPA: ABC transporter permease [bacterium]|nr:ABC transporter permease [bacterium]